MHLKATVNGDVFSLEMSLLQLHFDPMCHFDKMLTMYYSIFCNTVS